MKKLLLILVIFIGYTTHASYIQIKFVEGFNLALADPYFLSPSEGTHTTDSEINTILTNHGITYCIISEWTSPSSYGLCLFANYTGSTVDAFIAELVANPHVNKALKCYDNNGNWPTFADTIWISLQDNTNGNPLGIAANGTVVTTNSELNSLFTLYNVTAEEQFWPNSQNYTLYFEGDITGLKNALDALPSVIQHLELIPVVQLLNNPTIEKANTKIYPNPFSDHFTIDTKENISTYTLTDVVGKTILSTESKNTLDDQTAQLGPGMYVLSLHFANGEKVDYKMIKK